MKIFPLLPAIASILLLNALPARSQTTFNEVEYSPRQTVFKLNAPKQPKLTLYKSGQGDTHLKHIKMQPAGKNVWTCTVKGDLKGKFYTFNIGKGETPGVFAKAVGRCGKRGAIVDLKDTNPAGWDNDTQLTTKKMTDLVIYELHYRDFSVDPSSGLVNKGKFLCLTEKKAIDHLKELGINAVHVLPSFDFASVDENHPEQPQYNWGYDPLNYNVPEGSYSYDASNPTRRIFEFKTMVEKLHENGIRVILDVVYNHTFDLDHSNFNLTFPGAYYRYTADGKPSNGSGCGNETASEKPLMREFMLESVAYWAKEYHIDGFRFDLMGCHDIETMNLIRKELAAINPNIFVYGEGWSAGQCALPTDSLAVKANMKQMPGIAAFCDDMRDAIRGPFSDDHKGAFLAGLPGYEESIKAGIAGMVAHPQVDYSKVNYSKEPWALEPTQMISYVSCHDDMCLADRLRAELPGISTDEAIRLDKIAQTVVFLSQGVPFMLCGEEMFRTKQGVHNSYNSPDSINRIDWDNLKRYPKLYSYYCDLTRFRREHPAFRMGSAEEIRKHLEFLPTKNGMVTFMLKNHAGGDEWNNIIVCINAGDDDQLVDIPDGKWYICGDLDAIDTYRSDEFVGHTLRMYGQSVKILHD